MQKGVLSVLWISVNLYLISSNNGHDEFHGKESIKTFSTNPIIQHNKFSNFLII
jgi:hypothetical protein